MIQTDLKNSTKYNHNRRAERREVHSRLKRVTPSHPIRTHNNLNSNSSNNQSYHNSRLTPGILQDIIRDQWENNFQPQWFITLLWNDLPTRSETVISHSRHFRNVLLTNLYNVTLRNLPESTSRTRLVFFHERTPVISRNRCIHPFHTHLHLGAVPEPWNQKESLTSLIRHHVSPRVQKLLKSTTPGNQGVVIKPWNYQHHAFYNLKDYNSWRHHQDPDLILDYQNSDLRF